MVSVREEDVMVIVFVLEPVEELEAEAEGVSVALLADCEPLLALL